MTFLFVAMHLYDDLPDRTVIDTSFVVIVDSECELKSFAK